MRIITGSAKGIQLKTLDGEATRPTASRVKEAVFSILQFDIEGKRILDLFSGSGQMALEALSRGAASAVLVDKSREAVNVIKFNAQKTRLHELCTVYQADSLDFLRRCNEQFDIVFIDPPYASELYSPSLKAMLDRNILKQTSLVVCESNTEDVFLTDKAVAEQFEIVKKARYGTVYITVLTPLAKEA